MSKSEEIEVYCQRKKFIAKNLDEVDQILKQFKGWKTEEAELDV